MLKLAAVVAAVVALAGVGTGIALVVANRGETVEESLRPSLVQPSPTPTPAATPPAVMPEAATPMPGWATLTNTAFGYSIQYPADWLVNPYQPDVDPSTSNYVALYNRLPVGKGGGEAPPPDEIKIEIVVLDNRENLLLGEWVERHIAEDPQRPSVKFRKEIAIDGLGGIQQLASVGEFEFFTAYFARGTKVFIINGPQSNTQFMDSYNQLLSSFRAGP